MKQYKAGIDIGSTTVKVVVLNEKDEIIYGKYERHQAHTQETLCKLLKDAKEQLGVCDLQVSITGSGSINLGKALGIDFVGHAGKPKRGGYRKAMERTGRIPAQTAIVGDQIFTDILGGKRAGITTLLVRPIRLAGNPGRYIRYWVETPFRLVAQRRGKL